MHIYIYIHIIDAYIYIQDSLDSQEDSEAAALWIVETCRRWTAGVPSVPSMDTSAVSPSGDPPGRSRQQQQQHGFKGGKGTLQLRFC